ncbi:MAG TPA: serine/threonine-protein kinase [Thermoanaerobaculia bacterium]|nr:serine/threonine-protein kinase [Thermoanaerobaculia bacterium]
MPHGLLWRDIQLGSLLGEGHSGAVYEGRLLRKVGSLPEGSQVAVKRYRRSLLGETGQLERIFRERNAGGAVRHPNLVEVLGAVIDGDGNPALVMRFYEGETLEAALRDMRQNGDYWSPLSALELLRDIGAAIVALHGARIIHRDIKPANIILASHGPVLADLGVVRSEDFPDQTTTGVFLGSLRYAAPEYLLGGTYDQRVDIYAFGCIAYELMSGRQTFERHQHWAHLVTAKTTGEPPIKATAFADFASRSSVRIARFVQYVIEHSLCAPAERDLDIASFVGAVDQRLWRQSYAVTDGKLTKGNKVCSDRFGTATAAADFLRSHLTPIEMENVVAIYRAGLWCKWAPRREFDPQLLEALVEYGAVDLDDESRNIIHLVPSLIEAIALDLL